MLEGQSEQNVLVEAQIQHNVNQIQEKAWFSQQKHQARIRAQKDATIIFEFEPTPTIPHMSSSTICRRVKSIV
jgi:hypothetical protein